MIFLIKKFAKILTLKRDYSLSLGLEICQLENKCQFCNANRQRRYKIAEIVQSSRDLSHFHFYAKTAPKVHVICGCRDSETASKSNLNLFEERFDTIFREIRQKLSSSQNCMSI